MPDLRRTLSDYDLGFLRLIAELWGLELSAGAQREAAEELAGLMAQPGLAAEVVEALPPEARAALASLLPGGRAPLAQFTRRFGELRQMGPARRDRERPWANDPSSTETLWYRGLIGRAFFDEGRGPQEFVYIPDELRPLLPAEVAAPVPEATPPGEPAPAPPGPYADPSLAADDAVTLLAYLQVAPVRLEGGSLPARHAERLERFVLQPAALNLYVHLLQRAGLAAENPLRPAPEPVKAFLQATRAARARTLAEAWRDSAEWNDLLAVPGLLFEGTAWRNDPLAARRAVLALLAGVPAGTWWSLDSFVAAVKERQPDFQRPAGDYDSWYIRDAATQAYLRGFENWDRVDGALVRWLVTRPLCWLGLAHVAGEPPAFRLTPYGSALLGQRDWESLEAAAAEPITLDGQGVLAVPASASAYDRFQLARISDWLPPEETPSGWRYRFRLTPAALARASRKGITPARVLAYLEQVAAGQPALAGLAAAVRRWERSGPEAALYDVAVLKLASAELVAALRRVPGLGEYLGESLGPNAVLVRRQHLPQLREALLSAGILFDEG